MLESDPTTADGKPPSPRPVPHLSKVAGHFTADRRIELNVALYNVGAASSGRYAFNIGYCIA
jgi:hypothetical protein